MSRHNGIPPAALLATACAAILLAACESKDAADTEPAASEVDAQAPARTRSADAGDASQPLTDRAVVAETLPYAEVEDELVYGHFVFPADMIDPLPALIVIHEWWGLNGTVRDDADRLAAEGYIVLAIDLFAGRTADSPSDARNLMLQVVENPESANENIRQAYDWLQSIAGAPRIGALGWGFGGGWALNAALLFPDDLDAAVIYYGQVTNDVDKLMPLNVPLLGLFAAGDRGLPVESINAFESMLEELDKVSEIEIYPRAAHAFANPTGRNYDRDVAARAWTRTLEFLRTHLRPEPQ